MLDVLLSTRWYPLALWTILYISDFTFTMISASLYKSGANKHIEYEQGIELTPLYRRDVARVRWLNPRFALILILTNLLLWLLWNSTVGSGFDPQLFELVLGAWLLLEAAIHIRHFRAIFTMRYFKNSRGVNGKTWYSRWLSYRLSAVDMLAFAVLYLALYLLVGRQFFLGGALACSATALYHWFLGRRAASSIMDSTGSRQDNVNPGEKNS